MANNYSAGTIETNFNESEVQIFLTEVGKYLAKQFQEEYDPEVHNGFHWEGSDFWNMLSFDVDAAQMTAQKILDQNPHKAYEIKIRVAFFCDKPRMGEFGGFELDLIQEDKPVIARS